MRMRTKITGLVSAVAVVAGLAGAGGAALAAGPTAPDSGTTWGCVTGPDRVYEHVFTVKQNFLNWLATQPNGKCPNGFTAVAGGSASPTPTPTPTTTSPSPTPTPTQTSTSYSCTATGDNGSCGPYSGLAAGSNQSTYVIQDVWNHASAFKSQTTYANGAGDWETVANAAAGNGAVLSYPDTQDTVTNTSNQPVAFTSYKDLKSTYTVVPPASPGASDDWEYAYDIWLGKTGTSASNYAQEIMVWTFNHSQTPAGSDTGKTWTDPATGTVYEIWYTGGTNGLASLVAKSNATTGTLDVKNLFSELQSGGYTNLDGVNQIDYGVEVCSTSGANDTFKVTGYTLTGS